MKATANLRERGQSVWLDNITRALLQSGALRRYIDELSVTGLTSNPTIFDYAIGNSTDYDADIREKLEDGKSGEELFFELALKTPAACAECLAEGTHWVALRECQVCGHVGCCDSSPGRHATRPFRDTGHPVMRSITSGERWTWCYVQEIYGRLPEEGAVRKTYGS